MRDVEFLARHISFSFFIEDYAGRMKAFLDSSFERLNAEWPAYEVRVAQQVEDFDLATVALIEILSVNKVARKPDSRSFNKAIFDALAFYTRHRPIREWAKGNPAEFNAVYDGLFVDNERFRLAIESDTAGVPNTVARLEELGNALRAVSGLDIPVPHRTEANKIEFAGFE